jgi:anti-anti-sigma factor
MHVLERQEGPVTILQLKGKLVGPLQWAPLESAMERLLADGRRFVVLSCRDLDWVNSPGFGVIIQYGISLTEANGELVLADLNERVGRVVELLFSGPLELRTFESEKEACAHLRSRAGN